MEHEHYRERDWDNPSQGWMYQTCKNHPDYRWVRKDRRENRISHNPQLMFVGGYVNGEWHDGLTLGDCGSQSTLDAMCKKYGYVAECDCPAADLIDLERCEYGIRGAQCGPVIRGWHGRNICGKCLGVYRDGVDPNRWRTE